MSHLCVTPIAFLCRFQWPDFGVPSSPIAFLQFLKQVRDSGVLEESVGPAVIHCSAGIGRSGTFCLVDCCLVLIDKEGENRVSVQEVLLELRKYRMGLIQTHDQLTFSYEAIIEGMKRMNNDVSLMPVPKSLCNYALGGNPKKIHELSSETHQNWIFICNQIKKFEILRKLVN